MYLGRALRTKETLPYFRKRCRVTRHTRIFRGLTGSQRTPEFWGVTYRERSRRRLIIEAVFEESRVVALNLLYTHVLELYKFNICCIRVMY